MRFKNEFVKTHLEERYAGVGHYEWRYRLAVLSEFAAISEMRDAAATMAVYSGGDEKLLSLQDIINCPKFSIVLALSGGHGGYREREIAASTVVHRSEELVFLDTDLADVPRDYKTEIFAGKIPIDIAWMTNNVVRITWGAALDADLEAISVPGQLAGMYFCALPEQTSLGAKINVVKISRAIVLNAENDFIAWYRQVYALRDTSAELAIGVERLGEHLHDAIAYEGQHVKQLKRYCANWRESAARYAPVIPLEALRRSRFGWIQPT